MRLHSVTIVDDCVSTLAYNPRGFLAAVLQPSCSNYSKRLLRVLSTAFHALFPRPSFVAPLSSVAGQTADRPDAIHVPCSPRTLLSECFVSSPLLQCVLSTPPSLACLDRTARRQYGAVSAARYNSVWRIRRNMLVASIYGGLRHALVEEMASTVTNRTPSLKYVIGRSYKSHLYTFGSSPTLAAPVT